MEFDNVEQLKELMDGGMESDHVNWHEITQADIDELNDNIADSRMRDIQEFLYRFSR